jgi:hypothetical protein
MFKIENGFIKFEEFKIPLPLEVRAKTPSKIFGTSTAGLQSMRGVFLDANGASGRVGLANGTTVAGHILEESIKAGTLVYLREQLDVNNPEKIFWLISISPIVQQVNWLTVEFTDGSILRICPFTEYYNVS